MSEIVMDKNKIFLTRDEKVIKKYHCLRFKSIIRKKNVGDGYLVITSKRIITYSNVDIFFNKFFLYNDVPLQSAEGITLQDETYFKLFKVLVGVFLIALAIYCFIGFNDSGNAYNSAYNTQYEYYAHSEPSYIMLVAAFVFIILSIYSFLKPVSYFYLDVHSVLHSPRISAWCTKSFLGYIKNLIFFTSSKGSEANKMLGELGSIIADYKTHGEQYVINKYIAHNDGGGDINIVSDNSILNKN